MDAIFYHYDKTIFKNPILLKIISWSDCGVVGGDWRGLRSEHLPPIKSFEIRKNKMIIGRQALTGWFYDK